jgi:hypothetical protein
MRTNNIEAQVNGLTVVEIRKLAVKYGIKNPSKYRRVVLVPMVVEAIAKVEQKKANANKRVKADKVENDQVEIIAQQLLSDIETLGVENNQLIKVNRKVLIRVMKMLHCSKWYRTYGKATMIEKIKNAVA